jgi:hypothetical protein
MKSRRWATKWEHGHASLKRFFMKAKSTNILHSSIWLSTLGTSKTLVYHGYTL